MFVNSSKLLCPGIDASVPEFQTIVDFPNDRHHRKNRARGSEYLPPSAFLVASTRTRRAFGSCRPLQRRDAKATRQGSRAWRPPLAAAQRPRCGLCLHTTKHIRGVYVPPADIFSNAGLAVPFPHTN